IPGIRPSTLASGTVTNCPILLVLWYGRTPHQRKGTVGLTVKLARLLELHKPKEGGTLAGARPLSTPHSEIYSSRSFTSLLNWTWAASSGAGGAPGLA